MRIERVQPRVLRLDIHPMELAALITAARWVVSSRDSAPPPDAVEQLRHILVGYDRAASGLDRPASTQEQPANAR